MPHLRRMLTPSLFALCTFVLAAPGCDSGSVVDPGYTSSLRISSSPGELSPGWTLATSVSTVISGEGDTLLTSLEPGTYWLLWEPEPGWNSPVENPMLVDLVAGNPVVVEAAWSRFDGEPGTIAIDAGTQGATVLWNLRGPDSFFAAGTGSRVLPGRAPGEYAIVWKPGPDQASPPALSGVLEPGSTLALSAEQTPVPGGGTIQIDPNPDELDAPWELTIPGGDLLAARGDTVLTGMPTGTYSLRWGASAGFYTPDPVVAVLDPYSSLRFATTYVTPLHNVGTIDITISPAGVEAPWRLTSDAGLDVSGSGDSTLTYLRADLYSVTWGGVTGYLTPPPTAALLEAGAVLSLTGNYGMPGGGLVGDIHIDPTPDSIRAPWTLVSDTGFVVEGAGDSTLTGQPAGYYTLYWGTVQGYVSPTPNPVSRKLEPGGALGFSIQ